MEGGLAAAALILEHKTLPTAIMCSNDMLAIGVLHKLSRSGLQVPGDVSVIGFDDIHMAEMMIPSLTSVQMSRSDLAHAAVTACLLYTSPQAKIRFVAGTQFLRNDGDPVPNLSLIHI